MEKLTGRASNVRHLSETDGYVTIFTLDQRAVSYTSASPNIVNNGDEVAVVGEVKRDGRFSAIAYHNITNNVRGQTISRFRPWIWGSAILFLLCIPFSCSSEVLRPSVGVGIIGIGTVFSVVIIFSPFIVATYLGYLKVRQALSLQKMIDSI